MTSLAPASTPFQAKPQSDAAGSALPQPEPANAIRKPTPEQLERIDRQNALLETASPEDILAWAVNTYFPRFTMATGLGPEGCVIISMLAKIEPRGVYF